MIRSRIGRVVPVIAVVVLLLVGGAGVLSARGATPFDEILTKLDEIIGMLTPTAPPESVTLVTPALLFNLTHIPICTLTKVGPGPDSVLFRVVNHNGVVLSELEKPVPTGWTVNLEHSGGAGLIRCEFTFNGSAASSFRANLQRYDTVTNGLTSVDAR